MELGLIAIAAAIASLVGISQGFGEANIAIKAIDMMAKNPAEFKNIRSSMILGIALSETTAIYATVVAILIIFVLGGKV